MFNDNPNSLITKNLNPPNFCPSKIIDYKAVLFMYMYNNLHNIPWSERENWPNLKTSNISETREGMSTKIGMHACDINPYLHKFFEPILNS